MTRLVLMGMLLAAAVPAAAPAGVAQAAQPENSGEYAMLQRMGPDPLITPPPSLAHHVRQSPAAVVAEIVGRGNLKFEPLTPSQTVSVGFVTYRVVIRRIIYNRLLATAPPLGEGVEIEFTQRVGRESGRAFLDNQIPVKPGDECLLFLWHHPLADRWTMLHWLAQFRRSKTLAGGAESLGPPEGDVPVAVEI